MNLNIHSGTALAALIVATPALAGEVVLYTPWPENQNAALQEAIDAAGLDIELSVYRAAGSR